MQLRAQQGQDECAQAAGAQGARQPVIVERSAHHQPHRTEGQGALAARASASLQLLAVSQLWCAFWPPCMAFPPTSLE